MTYRRAFTISVVLHALLLVHALHMSSRSGSQPGQPESFSNVKIPEENGEEKLVIAESPIDVELVEKVPEPTQGEVEAKWQKHLQTCAHSFGGIGADGVRLYNGSVRVKRIYNNYPADAAGLQVDDTVLNWDDIKGVVGTPVTIEVYRNGITFQVTVVRGKICLEDIVKEIKP